MSYPVEYIVVMGYYPDRFANAELPIDVFFHHVRHGANFAEDCEQDAGLGAARHRCLMILVEAMEDCVTACKEKYLLDLDSKFSRMFDPQDCFWSCEPLPELEDIVDEEFYGQETPYIGADDVYPDPC